MHVGRVGLEPAPEHVDVVGVGLVVDRVGLGHAHHVAGLDLVGVDQPEGLQLPRAQGDEVLVGRRPELVALEHEVLEAEAGAAVLDQVRRPRAEVLDAADLDLGGVDVDPVVGEAGRLGHDQGDGEEVAVAGGRRPRRATSAGTGGSMALSSWVNGIEEITLVAGERSWPPASDGHGPTALVDGCDRPGSASGPSSPGPRTISVQRSHIIPGPYFGYWNSSMRLVISFWFRLGRRALSTALNSERFLMRWAAQSAWISVGRDAPDLLGVGLEEGPVEAPAEAGGDPALEVVLVLGRPDPHPEVGQHAEERLDEAEVAQRVEGLERVVEVLAVVVDPAHPGPEHEVLVVEDLVPELLDRASPW